MDSEPFGWSVVLNCAVSPTCGGATMLGSRQDRIGPVAQGVRLASDTFPDQAERAEPDITRVTLHTVPVLPPRLPLITPDLCLGPFLYCTYDFLYGPAPRFVPPDSAS
ncbi:hypothetical protein EDB84DRAFT_1438758 [Lactarius hengduanensis]|nr:hypothetical protein EDB84DRAFT_1438758 [Lactarius hengduanensis]